MISEFVMIVADCVPMKTQTATFQMSMERRSVALVMGYAKILARTMILQMESNLVLLVEECVVVVKKLVRPLLFKLERVVSAAIPLTMAILMVRILYRSVRMSFLVNMVMSTQSQTACPLPVLDFKPVFRHTMTIYPVMDHLPLSIFAAMVSSPVTPWVTIVESLEHLTTAVSSVVTMSMILAIPTHSLTPATKQNLQTVAVATMKFAASQIQKGVAVEIKRTFANRCAVGSVPALPCPVSLGVPR
jgi:hypothetical protein